MNNMITLLDAEIEEEFNEIAKLSPGSKEHIAAVESLTKLMDRKIEIEKLDISENHEERQIKEERKSRLVKYLIDIGLGIAPLMVTIWGAKATFKFEEEGTITTTAGRQFITGLFRKK